jgi:catechol 2,3-dioxygenase-like lactoylglutathione lyase family enzyme
MRAEARATLARVGRGVRILALSCAALTASCVTHVPSSATHNRAAVALAAPAQVRAVMVVGMTVSDIERSTEFFTNVLDFEKVADVEVSGPEYDQLWGLPGVRARIVRLRLGGQELELAEYGPRKGRAYPADSRSSDRWFQHVAIVVADMDAAYARIRSRISPISIGGPQTLPATNVAAAGISAFYFRDPDGHALELIHFPPGKGDRRWQDTRGRLFLGIDHTAIGVRATGASLAFYRDLLGLAVVGESLNVGTEQEHLTGVEHARVRITGLHTPSGLPGIELLDYRAPTDGRDAPSDAQTNDILHWHPTIVVADIDAAAIALRTTGDAPMSGVVTLPSGALGFTRAVVVRDPDGHALQLVAEPVPDRRP